MKNKNITLLLINYPGASIAAIEGLKEIFSYASRLQTRDGGAALDVQVTTSPQTLSNCAPSAIILPPAFGNTLYLTPDKPITDWLANAPQTCIVASACAGAFYLGAANLIENRHVTTHWGLEGSLQSNFPNARVNADEILISDGQIITAGGLLSWIDLALELIVQFSTPAIMREVGRHFVVDTGRREQRPYRAFRPPIDHGDDPIRQAQFLIERTFAAPIRISQLAETVALTERTFLRRFERATGFTPLIYVQHLRVESAQRALENSPAPIDHIAFAVGYENANAFRKLFKRHTGLSPSQYRLRLKR